VDYPANEHIGLPLSRKGIRLKIMVFAFSALVLSGCASRSPLISDATDKPAVARPVAIASEPAVPSKKPARIATPRRSGEMAFEAEKAAREAGCYRSESASLMAKRPGVEFYRVGCDAGNQVLVKCEMRQCRMAEMPLYKKAEEP
jgi:hypothetical protein